MVKYDYAVCKILVLRGDYIKKIITALNGAVIVSMISTIKEGLDED